MTIKTERYGNKIGLCSDYQISMPLMSPQEARMLAISLLLMAEEINKAPRHHVTIPPKIKFPETAAEPRRKSPFFGVSGFENTEVMDYDSKN